jgi:hypothetical protein
MIVHLTQNDGLLGLRYGKDWIPFWKMEVSIFMGDPQARWMVYFMENPKIKWMI